MSRLPRRVVAALTFCLALGAMQAGTAFAAPGDLDTSFGEDGAVFDGLSPSSGDDIRDPRVAQAPDGSLVAAVLTEGCGSEGCPTFRTFNGVIHVIRVSAAGEVIDETDVSAEDTGNLFDLRVLADGTITIATRQDRHDLRIIRLAAGLEPIGDAGIYDPASCGESDRLVDAAIREDGTVAGLWNCDDDGYPAVEVVDHDGVPLESFALTHLGEVKGQEGMYQAKDLALRPDGVIHVLGYIGDGSSVVARLLPGGGVDTTYGEDGFASWGGPSSDLPLAAGSRGAFAVDSLGRAVVGLTGNDDTWRLLRLTSAGAVDTGFGDQGVGELTHPALDDLEHLTIQGNNKILATGDEYEDGGERGLTTENDNGIMLARMLETGATDTGFGSGGFVVLETDDNSQEFDNDDATGSGIGPALEQADGRIVVPGGLEYSQQIGRAAVDAPPNTQSYLALFRLAGDPPAVTEQPRTETKSETKTEQQQQVQPKSCVSRRAFRIRIRERKARPIRRAAVRVNGKRVKVVRRGGRLTARIGLRQLPKGRFAVKISVRYKDGGKRSYTRRYRTCAGKLPPSNKLSKKNALR